MSRVVVQGIGAVSPAGWGVPALSAALRKGVALPTRVVSQASWPTPLQLRPVPPPPGRPAFLAHARMRRTSPITQFALAAALEALGAEANTVAAGTARLGIVFCVATGCVNYCRRFYEETLRDPATASPLVFPETVFNAPSSHLASFLGTTHLNYTLVGDPGTFLQGLALGGTWILNDRVDACLVVGAEESDWITSHAFRHFAHQQVLSEGAAAIYLKAGATTAREVVLTAVTVPELFFDRASQVQAARKTKARLPQAGPEDVLFDSRQGLAHLDRPEDEAWRDWPGARRSPKEILGEGLMAAPGWQCVAAMDALFASAHRRAFVSVVGCNEQVIGALFSVEEP